MILTTGRRKCKDFLGKLRFFGFSGLGRGELEVCWGDSCGVRPGAPGIGGQVGACLGIIVRIRKADA